MNHRHKLPLLTIAAISLLGLLAISQLRPSLRRPTKAGDTSTPSTESVAAAPASKPGAAGPTAPSPAPFPSLLAEARIGRPGPDSRPITNRYAQAPVVWSTERAGGANNEFIQRIRLVRTEMKYPLVRLEEILRRVPTPDGPKEFLLQQLAMVGDHLMVQPQPGMPADRFATAISQIGGRIRTRLRAAGTYLIEIPATNPESLPRHLADLRAAGVAATAEPDYIVHTFATPNDASYASLWGMNNSGGTTGTADADIDAPEAWDFSTGSRDVLVGVIDTGIDYNHPDLAANSWTNPGEIPGNAIDDDNNGFIDDIHGWDFCNDDSDPMDDHSHGTHCAGTIGGVGNNGIGIVGVNWRVSLVALKFLSAGGSGNISDAVEAVTYANRIGVNLTSNSWGGGGFSQLLKDAIDAAGTQSRLFIAAAGNNGMNTDASTNYPSGLDCANLIAVAATDSNDQLAYFSNYGETSVDLAAPGVDILSSVPGASYASYSGTSMATPHVAGAAALLKASYPQLQGGDIKSLLLATVDPLPALVGKTATKGRLNIGQAIQSTEHLILSAEELSASGSLGGPFDRTSVTYSLRNLSSAAITYTITCDESWLQLSTTAGTIPAGDGAELTVALHDSVHSLPAGKYTATFVLTEAAGGRSFTRHAYLEVVPPVVHSFPLNSDPGWSRTGQWAFGQPQGLGGYHANRDPASAFTGTNVLGINLAGDYATTSAGPDFVTTSPINLEGYANTRLRFRRWLNQESLPWALATIDISTDGTNWTSLWTSGSGVFDPSWTRQYLDLSAYADNQSTVYIRWGHTSYSGAWSFSGWNIDDIEILGQPPRTVAFPTLAPVPESIGSIATTLEFDPAPSEPTTITLSSSQPDLLSLPASIEAPAGATSIPITLTIHDDSVLNGTREVVLGIRAASYVGRTAKLLIHDNETASLTLTLPAIATEGGPATTGTVSASHAPATPVAIRLTPAPAGFVAVPATVLLPAGVTSVEFPITFPDNQRIDRSVAVGLTASVVNWNEGTGSITVQDNESTLLTVEIPEEVSESDGTLGAAGLVRIAGTLPAALIITLSSNDTGELTVPATVTIPAGASSATFALHALDDDTADGAQTVAVTARATGFTTAQASTVVADAAVHHFSFDLVPSPQYTGLAFPVRIVARDHSNNIASGFRGTITLTADSSGAGVPVSPTSTGTFTRGIWDGSVTLSTIGTTLNLHCTGGGATSNSNSFRVLTPPVQSFAVTNTDLAYSAVANCLYAATADGTLIPIDPATSTIRPPITVASTGLTRLEISGDGTQLFAVHGNNTQIVRVPVPALAPAESFIATTGDQSIHSVVTVPGQALSVAVATKANYYYRNPDRITVYTQGEPGPNTLGPQQSFRSITAGTTPGRIYGVVDSNYAAQLCRTIVDATGITLLDQRASALNSTELTAGGTIIADRYGRVVDGESNQCLATLPQNGLTCIDGPGERLFVMTQEYSTGWMFVLRCYDTTNFEELGHLNIPNIIGTPTRLMRWGPRGLAFRTETQVFLLVGNWIPSSTNADLGLSVVASPSPALVGQPLTYTLRVTNYGGLTADNIILTDLLPSSTTFVNASVSQGTVSRQGGEVTAHLGSLLADGEAVIRIQVTPSANGDLVNAATVLAATADPSTVNNQITLTTPTQAASPLGMRQVALGANDLVSDGEKLVATLSSSSPVHANSVAIIKADTLALLRTIPVGSNPDRIALTDDHDHAQIGLNGSFGMRPVNLATNSAGPVVPFEINTSWGTQYARDLIPLPASNDAVAVNRKRSSNGCTVAVYDGAIPRPVTIENSYYQYWSARSFTPAGLHLLHEDNSPDLSTYTIQPNGVSLTRTTVDVLTSYFTSTGLQSMGDTLVASNGAVIDAQAHTELAQLNLVGTYATDPDNQRVYCLTGPYDAKITAFDTATWTAVGNLSLGNTQTMPVKLVRWGRHGLAFLNSGGVVFSLEVPDLVPNPPLRVVLPVSATEGDGTLSGAGRVELIYPADSDLTVELTSSAPGVLAVPAAVVIPQGAKFADFDLNPSENSYLNGTRVVTITPNAAGPFTLRAASIAVFDDEVGTITLELPASAIEATDDLIGLGKITLSAPAGEPVSVQLASSDPTELVVPKTVVVASGQTSASFKVNAPDDDLLDGPQSVVVTASMTNWIPDAASITVEDSDPHTLTLSLPASTSEYNSASGTVSLSAKTLVPLQVRFTSNDPSVVNAPSTATIEAGWDRTTFSVYPVDNNQPNPSRSATITALASGFTPASQSITITDDDPASISWDAIAGPTTAGQSFATKITLRTLEGTIANHFYGNATLSAHNERGAAVCTPTTTNYLYNGTGETNVTVRTAGERTRLRATLPSDVAGDSAEFAVRPAGTSAFVWEPIASPQQLGSPVLAILHAADSFGNPTTDYTGSATLSALHKASERIAGTGTDTTSIPLGTNGIVRSRMTSVLPANELGASGSMRSIALDVSSYSSTPIPNVTVRLKHTTRSDYNNNLVWESEGWTVVYSGTVTILETGWYTFPFSTPFAYDGVSNLLVDISFSKSTVSYESGTAVRAVWNSNPYRTILNTSSDGTSSDPLIWNGTSPTAYSTSYRPNIRLGFGVPTPVEPTTTGAFTAGTWTGAITLGVLDSAVELTATDGAMRGSSNRFALVNAAGAPVIAPEPVWTAGTANSISWSSVIGAASYQAEFAADAAFTAPFTSGWTASTRLSFISLLDGTTYFYRVRASIPSDSGPAISPWSATVSSTQDAAPPAVAITSPLVATSTVYTLTGTAEDHSGLASVMVNGSATTTMDSYAHWSHPVTLQLGQNTFAISASDHATPAQTSTKSVTILLLPSTSDSDGDGLSDLLEYALGLDPLVANSTGKPSATIQINPGDGLSYLNFTYQRRLLRDGLTYHVETSSDLSVWAEVISPEELSTTANPDGVTETVTLRLQPAIDSSPRRFVRLKVTTP